MKTIAVSVGDLNGIGIELILKNHNNLKQKCNLVYCINKDMLEQCARLLNIKIPKDIILESLPDDNFEIQKGIISKQSGAYSFSSFKKAISLSSSKKADAILTMPIHKKAWNVADVPYKGHTDYLSHIYGKKAIMMLGCFDMYVALFSDHIPLKEVSSTIKYEPLKKFLISFYENIKSTNIAVLGLNPHSGDNGVLGDEDFVIQQAIDDVNAFYKKDIFKGTIVPDVAFVKHNRQKYKYFVAMYHDQGLTPLKALYFEQSINITLGLPINRVSVDHGCAFDIAYTNDVIKNSHSYINAINYLIKD